LASLLAAALSASAPLAPAWATDWLPRHPVLGAATIDGADGAKITSIRPGSPAQAAGLAVDDIIMRMDAVEVRSAAQLVEAVRTHLAGPAKIAVMRDGHPLEVTVTLASAPDETDPVVKTVYGTVRVDGSLRRTLVTHPLAHAARRPAVLIVGGIGCYSIDVATDPEDAYLRLAHDLGRRGVVAMRLEKSGVGDSHGPPCATTDFDAEIRSYAAAFDALRQDPDVDPMRVYIFGHSIGSLIAPRLALSKPVAGVIVAEGVGRNWFEYELWSLRRQLVLEGDSPDHIDADLAEKERCMHGLLIERREEAELERTEPDCRVHDAYPVAAAYLQEVAALNVAEPWAKLNAPVLAVYGDGDFVTALADHQRIVDIVNGAHVGHATLAVVPGMDHHLDRAGTPQQAYDLRVNHHQSGPYETMLSQVVGDWLCPRDRCG